MDAGYSYSVDQAMNDFIVGFVRTLAGDGICELGIRYGMRSVRKDLAKAGFDLDRINLLTGSFGSLRKVEECFGVGENMLRERFTPGNTTGFTGGIRLSYS